MNVAFYIDIVVGFSTSYIDKKTGDEIFSIRRIARNYIIEGDFVIDFLSTVDFLGFFSQILNTELSNFL